MRLIIERLLDEPLVWLAWRLPAIVVYRCFVRVATVTSVYTGKSLREVSLLDAMDTWRKLNNEGE